MVRPTAETIRSVDMDDFVLDILECEGYWTITYQGRPVSLRKNVYYEDGIKMKYPRTGFNNRAHCERLAQRLNTMFNSTEFKCVELTTTT
jgi:hypothetical protein